MWRDLFPDGITVLSLFDGMSCGQLALQKLGVPIKAYYAAEIDKYAMKVTQHNFPNTIQLGDVCGILPEKLPKIDLLIGGSPCQGFSFSGKMLAFDDPRSRLFFEFVRLKEALKPTYFLLENVPMKKAHRAIITQYMGISPLTLNSNWFSGQNRERLYWTNIGAKPSGLFGDMQCAIPQPKDKGILLRDILQPASEVAAKYYLSDKMISWLTAHSTKRNVKIKYKNENSEKSSCLGASALSKINCEADFIVNVPLFGCIRFGRTPEAKQLRAESLAKTGKDFTPFAEKEIVRVDVRKMNTLTTAGNKDNLLMQINPCTESGGKQPFQQNRVYHEDGIAPACVAGLTGGGSKIFTHGEIRRLTPIECERLQTVPDNFTACVSDTQRYKMLGNGWTVEVIAYIFSFMGK